MAPLQPMSNLKKGSFGLLMLLVLSACGGGGDSIGGPGSTDGTGVILTPTIVGRYLDANFYSVDVVQQVCEPGPPPVFETFTDHGARVTIVTSLIDPLNPSPGILYVEKYTVEYRRSADSIGAPPILSDTRFNVFAIVPPGTTTFDVLLVDLLRKARYLNDINSGLYTSNPPNILNNYTAIYTFEGQNQYGRAFSFKTQLDIAVGSFDYCT